MARFLTLLLYNLLYPVALLCMAPAAWRKMKARGGSASDLWQRLGFFDPQMRQRLDTLLERGPVWWMHAVSVGEVGVAARLIEELLQRKPTLQLVLSTTTPTGMALAQKLAVKYEGRLLAIYNPLDGWFTVRRCLRHIHPERLVLVEAEVWPNLVQAARWRGIPVSLVNARLSPRSEERYQRVLWLVRPIFSMLAQVFVQFPEDIARWERLGISRSRIACFGGIKYDEGAQGDLTDQIASLAKILEQMGWKKSDPVLLAASTHDGEEVEIAKICAEMRASLPELRLILVPRHAERSDTVMQQLSEIGPAPVLRSLLGWKTESPDESTAALSTASCLLVNSTGELRAWQHLATVVVIGKSFLTKGGQNPAEAVSAGKPVIFGPHMENFEALVSQLLAAKGAVQVKDFAELRQRCPVLLTDTTAAEQMAQAGRSALGEHEGATKRTADVLLGKVA
jgi:3-deoxy-D-manno-octulosonic-acid transferase